MSLSYYHLFNITQLTKYTINRLIQKANEIIVDQEHVIYNLRGKTLINYLLCDNIARSFQAAMYKLGGQVISISDITNTSMKKEEDLKDTIKSACYYGDVIIIRHPEKGIVEKLTQLSSIPIINASNDSSGEHPTQALVDIYTIHTELMKKGIHLNSDRRYPSLIITFIGDLSRSYDFHSLIHLLCFFPCIRFNYVCPDNMKLPEEIYTMIEAKGIQQEYTSFEEIIHITDIFYVTTIQHQIMNMNTNKNGYGYGYTRISESDSNAKYSISVSDTTNMKNTAFIMYSSQQDDYTNAKSVYLNQVKYGIYMKMAILHEVVHYSSLSQL